MSKFHSVRLPWILLIAPLLLSIAPAIAGDTAESTPFEADDADVFVSDSAEPGTAAGVTSRSNSTSTRGRRRLSEMNALSFRKTSNGGGRRVPFQLTRAIIDEQLVVPESLLSERQIVTDSTATDQWDPEVADPPNWLNVSALRRGVGAFPPTPPAESAPFPQSAFPDSSEPAAPTVDDYPHITSLDNFATSNFWFSGRPNLLNVDVPLEWDFYHILGTDRPDFTDSPFTVGQRVSIVETGYTFRRTIEDNQVLHRRQLPESLLRVGVSEELELRFKWNGYVMTDQRDRATGLRTSGYGGDDLQFGIKYELAQQHNWRPMITYVGMFTAPTGTGGVSANEFQNSQTVIVGWGLRRWLYLKAGTGVDFVKKSKSVIFDNGMSAPYYITQRDNVSDWHQSVSLLYQISKHFGGFHEWFGFFRNNAADNRPSNFYNTGLYYYVTPNVQFDVRIGTTLQSHQNEKFTGAGFSVRF